MHAFPADMARLRFGVTPRSLLISTILAVALLVGCDPDSSPEGTIELPLELQTRDIDPEDLELEMRLNDSAVEVERIGATRWRTRGLTARANTQAEIEARFRFDDLDLALARLLLPVPADATDLQLRIPPDRYDTTFDFDEDRRSNLDELEDDTDPRDADDPGGVVADVRVSLRFTEPAPLDALDDEQRESLRLAVRVNGEELGVESRDDVRLAETVAPADSRAFVEAEWIVDNPSALTLASVSRSEEVRGGAVLQFGAAAYVTRFDDDLDGADNIEELLADSDPMDAGSTPDSPTMDAEPDGQGEQPGDDDIPTVVVDQSDDDDIDEDVADSDTTDPDDENGTEEPVVEDGSEDDDPVASALCRPTRFVEGCLIDTDGDGLPDSVEGEDADRDDDSEPDWLESAVTDDDDDGTTAQFDPNEDDPCSPDNRAERCVLESRDSDGDGKLDAEEGETDSDGDGKLDRDESFVDDADDDAIVDELDPDDDDPCVPEPARDDCE